MSRRDLPGRTLNHSFAGPSGEPAIMIEAIPVAVRDEIDVAFVSARSPWRQGIWFATTGELEIADVVGPQMTLWSDTAPPRVRIRVRSTDGWLRFYNVWDSRRPGKGGRESQSHTSGMIATEVDERTTRYGANDIGDPPDFAKLVFTITRR